jgi:RNA 2',3'-cyclic 3'-phosphodiesterase
MRLFLAIELPDDVREHLARVQERVRESAGKASYPRAENLHVTLKFLGETRDKDLPPLCESLAKVSGGSIELTPTGIECFPEKGPVRVITAAMGGSADALAALHKSIEQRCHFLGFDRERRKYRPHVTLARARPTLPSVMRDQLRTATAHLFSAAAFTVRDFVLMSSQLFPKGSQYAIVARFPLNKE